MNKKIEFFNIVFDTKKQICTETINLSNESLKANFPKEIQNEVIKYIKTKKVFNSQDNAISMEFIELNEQYIFGYIAKSNNVKQGLLKRIIDTAGKEILETDLLIENFKYFLIDIATLNVAVLQNTNVTSFRTIFNDFLSSFINKNIYCNLNILHIIDNNVFSKINRFKKIKAIEAIFKNDSIKGNEILRVKDGFNISQNNYSRATIYLKLKKDTVSPDDITSFINKDAIKKDFIKYELVGEDEDNIEQTIELVKQYLSKNIIINIEEEYLQSKGDLEEIKKSLLKGLSTI